jgi:hypothetical protein
MPGAHMLLFGLLMQCPCVQSSKLVMKHRRDKRPDARRINTATKTTSRCPLPYCSISPTACRSGDSTGSILYRKVPGYIDTAFREDRDLSLCAPAPRSALGLGAIS